MRIVQNLNSFFSRRYALLDVYYFERRGSYGRYLRQNPSHGIYVNKGIYQSVAECRRLFKHDRWNCVAENQHEPFGNVVRKGITLCHKKEIPGKSLLSGVQLTEIIVLKVFVT
jgi:wnt family.